MVDPELKALIEGTAAETRELVIATSAETRREMMEMESRLRDERMEMESRLRDEMIGTRAEMATKTDLAELRHELHIVGEGFTGTNDKIEKLSERVDVLTGRLDQLSDEVHAVKYEMRSGFKQLDLRLRRLEDVS